MKRSLSVILSIVLLSSLLLSSLVVTHASPERVTKLWYEANFDNGELQAPFGIRDNYDEGGPTAAYEFAADGEAGQVLHIKDRTTNYGGLEINVSDMVKNTVIGEGEGYSMGFRIKAEAGEEFYVSALVYGSGDGYLHNNYMSWKVTGDDWTTVNLGDYFFKKPDSDNTSWMNGGESARIVILTTSGAQGDTGNPLRAADQKGYYIDDVKITAPADSQEEEETERASGVWYETDFDNGELQAPFGIRDNYDEGGPTAAYEFAADGEAGRVLHIKDRTTNYGGLEINVSDMVKNTVIGENEGYSMGFRIKAEAGEEFYVSALVYGSGDGYLHNNYMSWKVTGDDWTTVNLGDYFFKKPDSDNTSWMNGGESARIVILTTSGAQGDTGNPLRAADQKGYYIDDIRISAPYDQSKTVAAFVQAVQALPNPADITLNDKAAIDEVQALFDALGAYTGLNQKAVETAKARLDAVRNAYDALPSIPEEEDPSAPDAFTETFRDYPLGPTENEDGSPNEGKCIEKDPAHVRENGGRYLHITDRPSGDESPFYWHNVNKYIQAQGAGKYELRFWAKTDSSEGTRVQLIKGSTYLNPPVTITSEWAQYTVKLETAETAVSEADVESGFNFVFINNYMTNTAGLYLDDIACVKTGELPSTEPEDSDALIPDGGFENAAEGEEQWTGVIVRDESQAQEGSQFLLVENRPAGDETSLWSTALNADKLAESGAGNYKLSFWLRAAQAGKQTRLNAYIVGKKDGQELSFYFNMTPGTEGKNAAVAGDQWTRFESEPLTLPELDSATLYICNWYNSETDRTAFCLDSLSLDPTADVPSTDITIEPEYTYDNAANLLDPYGSFDTLKEGNKLWNGVVITDPAGAHSGDNYLKISDRHAGDYKFNFCVGVGDIIRDNGAGKYYYSCWLRTAETGKTTTLQPILYFHDTAAEYWMASITVTDEWTFFGVTYDQVEKYFNDKGDGLPLPGNVAEFRFYNAPGESEYPDYLVDDMAFWKYTGSQEDPGNQENPGSNPDTGAAIPALPAVLASGSAALMLLAGARKRRKKMNCQ